MTVGEGGGGQISLQSCITFFKIDVIRVTLIESYTEYEGREGVGGGVSAGKYSHVRYFNTG